MKRPVLFRRAAAKQVEEAHAWWRDNRLAAPYAIREEIERAVGLIAVQPRIGAPATNTQLPGVRRLLLSRVSYWLYYREGPERVDVLASGTRGAMPGPRSADRPGAVVRLEHLT